METITITKNNECDDMIVRFQDGDDLNPSLDAVRLFNALIEHLPGGTMTELYRQFVKNARLFDAAATNLLAVAEMTVEWINEPGKGRTNIYPKLHRISRELTAAIAAAKGDK